MKHRYALNLSGETLAAIGTVSAQWATLEYYLSSTTRGCIQRFKNPESKLSLKTAFSERRNAFQEAFMWSNVPQPLRESASRLVDRIVQAEEKRHKIIHGMANEDSPDDLPVNEESVHIMRDHPKHYFSERYSIPQILAIADEIADINGDMLAMYFYLWAGIGGPP
jgi:hypothetical protein